MNRRLKKMKGLLLVDKRKEKNVVEEVKVAETPVEEVVEEVKEEK